MRDNDRTTRGRDGWSRHLWRRLVPLGVGMVAALALASAGLVVAPGESDASIRSLSWLDDLRARVETPRGAPQPGRDPASQRQRRLSSAASEARGNGRRVAMPARSVRGDRTRRVTPAQVFGAIRERGLSAAGCFVDYGRPGAECLPAHAAQGRVVTCVGVRAHFPNGIVVSGTDRFRLDRNRDGVACGRGD